MNDYSIKTHREKPKPKTRHVDNFAMVPRGAYLQLKDSGTYAQARYNQKRRMYRLAHFYPGMGGVATNSDHFMTAEAILAGAVVIPDRPTETEIDRIAWGAQQLAAAA